MIAAWTLLAVAGFALLCMGMSRHQRDVLGKRLAPGTARATKWGGWACIAASYAGTAMATGPALGSVYWVGELTLAALAVSLTVTRLSR